MAIAVRRVLRNYALYFLVWTVLGLFFFSQAIAQKIFSHDPTPWWHYLASWLVGVYLWALFTPFILWLGNRLPFQRWNWMRRAAVHLLLSVVICLADLAIEASILYRLGVFPAIMTGFRPTLIFLLMIGFHQGVLTYFSVLAAQYGVRYYRQYQERQ